MLVDLDADAVMGDTGRVQVEAADIGDPPGIVDDAIGDDGVLGTVVPEDDPKPPLRRLDSRHPDVGLRRVPWPD